MSQLRRGLRGEPVRRLQGKLRVKTDGVFGADTEAALKAFQEENSLKVDGVAGPDTFCAVGLYELVLLQPGQRGVLVRRLQQALGIEADGVFGAATEAALKAYQEDNELMVDGIAGPETLETIDLFTEFTPQVVALANVPTDYVEPAPAPSSARSPLPEPTPAGGALAGVEPLPEIAKKGVWGTVRGWLS